MISNKEDINNRTQDIEKEGEESEGDLINLKLILLNAIPIMYI